VASYRLTDNEVTSFVMAAKDYIKLSVPYTQILPIQRIQDGYTHKWYVNTEVEGPAGSHDGREGYDVRTARTEKSANITSYVYTFEIPRVEVTMAQQSGVPIWSENVAAAMRKLNDQILHLMIRGSNKATGDKVTITGMYGGGTDVDAGLDDDKWDTITNPIDDHLAAGFGDLNTAGFKGPFTWLLSSNLAPGLKKKYGAGDPSQEQLVDMYDVNEIIYLPCGTVTRMNIYPMGAPTGDDGLWFLYKKDPNVAYLAEVMPPTTTLDPNLDIRRQCYHGRIEWRGTVAISQATGISWEDQVDLA